MQVKLLQFTCILQVKSREFIEVKNKGESQRRSNCPIACTLDIVGDRWTMLIIRDMLFFNKSRFDEFLASPEGISTNILSARLKKLEEDELIAKSPYGSHSRRMSYELTAKGRSLGRLVRQFAQWGLENIRGTDQAAH